MNEIENTKVCVLCGCVRDHPFKMVSHYGIKHGFIDVMLAKFKQSKEEDEHDHREVPEVKVDNPGEDLRLQENEVKLETDNLDEDLRFQESEVMLETDNPDQDLKLQENETEDPNLEQDLLGLESVKTEKPDFDLSMAIDIVDNLAEFIKAKPDEDLKLQENKVKLETENPNLEQDLLVDNLAEFIKAEFVQEEIDFNE